MHHRYDPQARADRDGWQADIGGIDVTCGPGSLRTLGNIAQALGGRRALLVSDPGLVAAGHVARAQQILASSGIRARIFDGVAENPTTAHVEAGLAVARELDADILIGLGGGSAMDCAKGINFLLAGGGRIEDYKGYGLAKGTLLPSIGVPTTAGTGSEAQSFALLARAEDHAKMACGDPQARFRDVILDPELLASLPRSVAAVSALDAISHAVESFVTRRRNPISQMNAREAWRLLHRSYEPFLDHRTDQPAAGDMLLGAHLAGAAIEASMLGAAHACANPLTAHYGVTHGIAVALMLPHVVRFNATSPEGTDSPSAALYGDLARTVGLNGDAPHDSERLARRLSALTAHAGLPATLQGFGVPAEILDQLADEAAGQWTAQFNPRATDAAALRRLYDAAYGPLPGAHEPHEEPEATLTDAPGAIPPAAHS